MSYVGSEKTEDVDAMTVKEFRELMQGSNLLVLRGANRNGHTAELLISANGQAAEILEQLLYTMGYDAESESKDRAQA